MVDGCGWFKILKHAKTCWKLVDIWIFGDNEGKFC
jgi:hypothetical protein